MINDKKEAILDFYFIKNKIIFEMPELNMPDYFKVIEFLKILINHKLFKNYLIDLKNLEAMYIKENKFVSISFLFKESEEKINLSGIEAYTENASVITKKYCRKNEYYLNLCFYIDDINEKLIKLYNIENSYSNINKFKL